MDGDDGSVRPAPIATYSFACGCLNPVQNWSDSSSSIQRPLADELRAEVSPLQVDAGVETPFVLSLQMRREDVASTGFRFLSVQTPAQVFAVDSVRVDDETVIFTAEVQRDGGFDVNLWERVVQDGSFVQLFFRAAIFVDGTLFKRACSIGVETWKVHRSIRSISSRARATSIR